MDKFIFDKEFLNRLEHLVFLSKKIFSGEKGGVRRSGSHGSGLEYADHRQYNSGDDMRYIDWNVYGRSGKLYTKTFLEDEDLNIYVLIDRSRSMDYGQPSKLDYALKLAASLGYVGLSHLERVGAGYFSDTIERIIPPRRGKHHVFTYMDFLFSFVPGDSTDLNTSLENFSAQVKVPGLLVILSDFMDEKGYERGLNYLLYRKFDVHVLQVLSRQEIAPDLTGPLRLKSLERDEYRDMDIDARDMELYREELSRYNSRLRMFCESRGILYQQAITDIPFDSVLTEYFQRQL